MNKSDNLPRLKRFGYQAVENLYKGGMATIVHAKNISAIDSTSPDTVFKIARTDRGNQRGLQNAIQKEAGYLTQFQSHPYIVNIWPVSDANEMVPLQWGMLNKSEAEGSPNFLVLELLGNSLSEQLRRHGVLPSNAALVVLYYIARTLAYIHRHGCVHRDLTLGNILYRNDFVFRLKDAQGENFYQPLPVLIDFGISAAHGSDAIGAGTEAWMAPELVLRQKNRIDISADVYSLGLLCGCLLTNEWPKEKYRDSEDYRSIIFGDSGALSEKIQNDWSLQKMKPEAQKQLQDLLYRMLSPDPAERPRAIDCAADLAKTLKAIDVDLPDTEKIKLSIDKLRGQRAAPQRNTNAKGPRPTVVNGGFIRNALMASLMLAIVVIGTYLLRTSPVTNPPFTISDPTPTVMNGKETAIPTEAGNSAIAMNLTQTATATQTPNTTATEEEAETAIPEPTKTEATATTKALPTKAPTKKPTATSKPKPTKTPVPPTEAPTSMVTATPTFTPVPPTPTFTPVPPTSTFTPMPSTPTFTPMPPTPTFTPMPVSFNIMIEAQETQRPCGTDALKDADTWNSENRDAPIRLKWSGAPVNARAFELRVAKDTKALHSGSSAHVNPVKFIDNYGAEFDAKFVKGPIEQIKDSAQGVTDTPYVWGIFYIQPNGSRTLVSPACWFKLDKQVANR